MKKNTQSKNKKTTDNKLSAKREKFCNLYVEIGVASEAYRRVYNVSKSKEETVWESASRLLSDRKVNARVEELKAILRNKSDITKERILKELQCIAFADIRDFVSIKDGEVIFKNSSEWTDEMARAVESVKSTREGIELKLNGKNWSIQRICKMLGFDEPTVIDMRSSLLKIDTGID